MSDEHNDLKVAVARLETALTMGMKNVEKSMADLAHDIKNLRMSLQSFVPRSEIDAKVQTVADRVKNIEDDLTFYKRAIIGAWISGFGVVGTGIIALLRMSGHG